MVDTLSDPELEKHTEGVLPCLVCGNPVLKGDWFFLTVQAVQTVKTGTPTQSHADCVNYVPQKPVHLSCVSTFPKKLE